MKKSAVLALALALLAADFAAAQGPKKILYAYDEANEQSTPYIGYFREAFAARGLAFDEAAAAELGAKDLAAYDRIVLHGMVMAFATKSPLRDWLKQGPALGGKKVWLLVTANRWFLAELFGRLAKLARVDGAELVDAVSMATKDKSQAEKSAAVRGFVEGLAR
jgi:hypothetical protein